MQFKFTGRLYHESLMCNPALAKAGAALQEEMLQH